MVSLRFKIMGIVLFLLVLLGLWITMQMRATLNTSLGNQLEKQGISLGRDVAARSTDYIFTNNLFALHELIQDTVRNNEDVRYVFILDQKGEVVVHTFKQGMPEGLRTVNRVNNSDRYQVKILETEEGLIYDIAVPIFDGRAGVARVGLSEKSIREIVIATTRSLMLSTMIVSMIGVLAAYALTALLTAPVNEMVQVTRAVAQGNLNKQVRVWWAKDEIGQLAQAFNSMIISLQKSRQETEDFSRQVVKRNQELAAYNTIAAIVGQSLNLKVILSEVLAKILETTQLSFGKIFVFSPEGEKMVPIVQQGEQANLNFFKELMLGEGIVELVANKGEPVIIPDLSEVTQFALNMAGQAGGFSLAVLPLKSKTRVVGVMLLLGSEKLSGNEDNMQLLTTFGRQIGVAIENATLWEELKAKEELRTKLLEKVISAQEEERKRIARELHDQTSQSLTSLKLGLKLISEACTLEEVKERVDELRTVTNGILEDLHDLALELRPSVLDDLGLEAALQRYTKDWSKKFSIEVDLHCSGLVNFRLPPQVETTVYRVVQETLTNAARYARATAVSIIVERRDNSLVTIIEDDGVGFEVQRVRRSPLEAKKLGIFGMEERVSLIDGSFAIESEPGAGTTVYVKVPLEGMVINHD